MSFTLRGEINDDVRQNGKMEVYSARRLADALAIAGLLCNRRES